MKRNNNNKKVAGGRQPRALRHALTLRTLLRVALLLVGGPEGGFQEYYRLTLAEMSAKHRGDRVAQESAQAEATSLRRRLHREARSLGVPGFLLRLLENPGTYALALDELFERLYERFPLLRTPLKRILKNLLMLLRGFLLELYMYEPGTDSSDDDEGGDPGASVGVGPQARRILDLRVGQTDQRYALVGN